MRSRNEFMGKDEGFVRLTADEVKDNLLDAIARVVLDGERIVLQQAEQEVAALIPMREFDRLEYLLYNLIPPPFDSCDFEFYESERGIHCVYLDEMQADFERILAEVKEDGEFYGVQPPENLRGRAMDIFIPVAILMPIDKFWIPEYLMHEKNRR